MKVAITSTVVLEIEDRHAQHFDLDALRNVFRAANEWAIGKPMETVNGMRYRMLAIEHFELKQQ